MRFLEKYVSSGIVSGIATINFTGCLLQEKTGATRSGQPGLDNPILKDIDMMPGYIK